MTKVIYVSEAWCSPCQVFWPIVSEACQNNGVSVTKVTASDPQVSGLGISSVPTVLFYRNGELVLRKTGLVPKQVFESLLKSI